MGANNTDTIYALGSPLGKSALAVVRVSGSMIPEELYSGLSINKKERGFFVRRLQLGGFSDVCLVLNFPGPHSYSGEGMLEIHPHGNPVILSELFSWLEGFGIREASAGEFSRRGFMNNRLSLADAEGVALGIEAETKEQLLALEDFRCGSLGQKVAGLLGVLEGLLVKIESQLDFSDEEDVVEVLSKEIKSSMGSSCDLLSQLVHDYRPFEKEAIKKNIVLVGKPNVGKSSLFNALVNEKVAIVSEVAGTTRDVVRKSVVMAGFAVEIQDTAGLNKNTSDPIEKEGMLLTERAEKNADLVLRVVDDVAELKDLDNNEGCLVVLNKCDLLGGFSAEGVICVSAKTGQGVAGLVEKIGEFSALSAPEKLVSSRIYNRLVSVSALLSTPLQNDDLFEFSAQLIRDSLVELKEIYGGFDNEKILDQIFENFCIGK